MLPIHLEAMLRLLAHSWSEIDFKYDDLTSDEHARISRQEFEDTVELMVAYDVIKSKMVPA
jgi:hypothetical protein